MIYVICLLEAILLLLFRKQNENEFSRGLVDFEIPFVPDQKQEMKKRICEATFPSNLKQLMPLATCSIVGLDKTELILKVNMSTQTG